MTNLQTIALTVNGEQYERPIPPRLLLVDFLRNDLRLTGTHAGCETSQCGCCVVLLNGQACKSCTLLAVQANGAEITTVEGLTTDGQLHPAQEAFRTKHGLQCGFCTPGMVMLAVDLLSRDSNPSEDNIREALHGNLCRCTGYQHIVDAVLEAARIMSSTTSDQAAQ